jgi:FdhE protein
MQIAAFARHPVCLDNCPMTVSPWQRRIQRAQELAGHFSFAAEILNFYIHLARFQQDLHHELSVALPQPLPSDPFNRELGPAELSMLVARFESFLSVAETYGPRPLAELSCALRSRGLNFWSELLQGNWITSSRSDAQVLLAQAFLQPYAELLRSCVSSHANQPAAHVCSFCRRKPGFGVLRSMGDSAARSLVCAFCLAEWDFRRLVCPGCGEENDAKLPVFTASDFDYIRVECCDTCRTYIKTVDLTKNGRAEPIVDELAALPLDLWARGHGYAKVQNNLLGM